MKEIIKAAQMLLGLLEKHHSPREEVKVIDKTIDTLESVVYIIQSNWIPKEERLERAKKKRDYFEQMVKFYEDTH